MRSSSLRRVFSQRISGEQPLLRSACDEMRATSALCQELVVRHLKAMEKLLVWSLHEDNAAIQDVIRDCLDSVRGLCDAQDVFARYVNEAAVELSQAGSGSPHLANIRQAERQLAQCAERESKLRKELNRALYWRKGGRVRLLELRLEEVSLQRQEARIYLEAVKAETEAVKMLCFKKAMLKLCETWALVGKCTQLVFDTQRRLVAQIPDVEQENIYDMYYMPDEEAAATLDELKDRLENIVIADQQPSKRIPGKKRTPKPVVDHFN